MADKFCIRKKNLKKIKKILALFLTIQFYNKNKGRKWKQGGIQMKILITTDWYVPIINGVVTSVMNLEQELKEKGHEVKILTLSRSNEALRKGNIYYIKSFYLSKVYPQARATLAYHNEFLKEIVRWKPDIIHSQCELVSFPFAKKIARKCKCPIIHTYHTVYEDYTHYFTKHEQAGKKAVALGSRYFLSRVDSIIAPTEKVKELLEEYGVKKRIATIPSGIDLKKFNKRLSESEMIQMKRKLGIKPEDKVLLTVGRLAKEKNVQELIHYINAMEKEDSRMKLLVVGDGPYREELEQLTEQLQLSGNIIFTGMVSMEEIYKYYQLGDIFVCASTSETQGLTYMEALASGLPAVCRTDNCIQNVIVNGSNGYQYNTFEEFMKEIRKLLDDAEYYETVVYHARLSAEKFSTWMFAEKVENVYRNEMFANKKLYEHKLGDFFKKTAC